MRYIIGVDEVGRGSLAGPVVVSALCLPHGTRLISKKLGALKDSKKLSPTKRVAWVRYFKKNKNVSYALGRVYPRMIERKNITQAANSAAWRAIQSLMKKQNLHIHQCDIVLDGGLYAKKGREKIAGRTIVRGDELFPAIKAASIVAKVARDRYMVNLAKVLPLYGFEKHKGYGTKAHMKALRQHGPSKEHRLTFINV